jgi:hypothetical protein
MHRFVNIDKESTLETLKLLKNRYFLRKFLTIYLHRLCIKNKGLCIVKFSMFLSMKTQGIILLWIFVSKRL